MPRKDTIVPLLELHINQAKVLTVRLLSMPIWYKLMAVIEHRGGPYSGHYVCYRRDPSVRSRRGSMAMDFG